MINNENIDSIVTEFIDKVTNFRNGRLDARERPPVSEQVLRPTLNTDVYMSALMDEIDTIKSMDIKSMTPEVYDCIKNISRLSRILIAKNEFGE